MNDTLLIDKIKEQDNDAFRFLVEKYQTMVINVCYGIVQNRTDAEDVAQDVFIEVYRNAECFMSKSKLSTWIYRIAVNRSLNYQKKNRYKSRSTEIDNMSVADSYIVNEKFKYLNSTPDEEYETKQRIRILQNTISLLPKRQQTALVLFEYEDLSYKEIADVMEVSVSSVESLIFRAKSNIKKKLFKYYKKQLF